MSSERDTGDAYSRLNHLCRDFRQFFNWNPSPLFVNRIRLFAKSVGPGNLDDLLSLVACEASEWHAHRVKGNFFHEAFRTHWVATRMGINDVDQFTEDDLEVIFRDHISENPGKRENPTEMSVVEILYEDTILRALDQERQRWRREAKKRVANFDIREPVASSSEDPSDTANRSQMARDIRQFVGTHFGEEGNTLFQARFEQALSYAEIARIFGDKQSVSSLRKQANRMKTAIRDHFAHRFEDTL